MMDKKLFSLISQEWYVDSTHGFGARSPNLVERMGEMLKFKLPEDPPPAFNILKTLTFKETEHRDSLIPYFQELAKHVKDNEPDTMAYECLINGAGRHTKVVMMARYRDNEKALKV